MNYPSMRLDIDRVHAAELGLSQKVVIDNVITALNSNVMIAPNYWVDYKPATTISSPCNMRSKVRARFTTSST